jgi:hypothetical protein
MKYDSPMTAFPYSRPCWLDDAFSAKPDTWLVSRLTEERETNMQDNAPQKMTDAERLRAWMDDIGGSLFVGDGKVKSVKMSKSGKKLTVVMKKKKAKDEGKAVA